MLEVIDVFLLLCFILFLSLIAHLKTLVEGLEGRLNESIDNLGGNNVEIPNFSELKEDILDVVNSTIENLQPPTALDHIAGAASQYFQMRMMREFNLENAVPQIGAVIETAKDVVDAIQND